MNKSQEGSGPGQVTSAEYEITGWTSHITTWNLYEGKRFRGRPARRWRDELDDYWKGTIWQRIAHREVCLISIQLRGCNYHTMFALGTVHIQESGGREASSDQSNTDAPHLTHQRCGYEGQKLHNTSLMPNAPRRKWMDACRRRVCPSPVSRQISTSCRLHIFTIC